MQLVLSLHIASSVNLTAFLTSPKFWVCGPEDETESKSEIHQYYHGATYAAAHSVHPSVDRLWWMELQVR